MLVNFSHALNPLLCFFDSQWWPFIAVWFGLPKLWLLVYLVKNDIISDFSLVKMGAVWKWTHSNTPVAKLTRRDTSESVKPRTNGFIDANTLLIPTLYISLIILITGQHNTFQHTQTLPHTYTEVWFVWAEVLLINERLYWSYPSKARLRKASLL